MKDRLSRSDILIDATQRPDPTRPVIPNKWISFLPSHAVILDLSVDPYDCSTKPPHIKGIEGVPQGNLDQFVFTPRDPAFDSLPKCVNTEHRRHSVSCYSWPGVYPKECMQIYGKQLQPVLRKLIEKEGIQGIHPIHVLVLGSGMVGKHAVEAACKVGNIERNNQYMEEGFPGVVTLVAGRNLSSNPVIMEKLFSKADVLRYFEEGRVGYQPLPAKP